MRRRLSPFHPLEGAQEAASDPTVHAALSASAGTGKTHVLTSRVLRLLLRGTPPAAILCLTFTKAGAAEMANRLGERPHDRPVHLQQIFATVYKNLGIDVQHTTLADPNGRPQYLVDHRDVIGELI